MATKKKGRCKHCEHCTFNKEEKKHYCGGDPKYPVNPEDRKECFYPITGYKCQKCGKCVTDDKGCTQEDGRWFCEKCDENYG